MFYLKELLLRFKYLALAFSVLLLMCYFYKDTLFLLIILSIIDCTKDKLLNFDHFIYTHPTEVFQTYIWLTLALSLFFLLPYLFWQGMDFLKSSLYQFEYMQLKNLICAILFLLFGLNYLGFFYIFPMIWVWFIEFNQTTNIFNSGLNFFF